MDPLAATALFVFPLFALVAAGNSNPCLICGFGKFPNMGAVIDANGGTCGNAYMASAEIVAGTSACSSAQTKYKACCGSTPPAKPPQATARPTPMGPMGPYPACQLCPFGLQPTVKSMVITILNYGSASCPVWYDHFRLGKVDPRTCSAAPPSVHGPCGCKRFVPTSNKACGGTALTTLKSGVSSGASASVDCTKKCYEDMLKGGGCNAIEFTSNKCYFKKSATKTTQTSKTGTSCYLWNPGTAAMVDGVEVEIVETEKDDLAEKNCHRRQAGVGGFGGTCKCPDGQEYNVGDIGDGLCASLACTNGTITTTCSAEGAVAATRGFSVTCGVPCEEDISEETIKAKAQTWNADTARWEDPVDPGKQEANGSSPLLPAVSLLASAAAMLLSL